MDEFVLIYAYSDGEVRRVMIMADDIIQALRNAADAIEHANKENTIIAVKLDNFKMPYFYSMS